MESAIDRNGLRMPLLFSYGTLQLAEVQLATFGRLLQGKPDALPEFELSRVVCADAQYANVMFNGRSDSIVAGTVFEVTETELNAADDYERDADYERVMVRLASGQLAWVYVHGAAKSQSAPRS